MGRSEQLACLPMHGKGTEQAQGQQWAHAGAGPAGTVAGAPHRLAVGAGAGAAEQGCEARYLKECKSNRGAGAGQVRQLPPGCRAQSPAAPHAHVQVIDVHGRLDVHSPGSKSAQFCSRERPCGEGVSRRVGGRHRR